MTEEPEVMPVLANRAAVAESIAPLTGEPAETMRTEVVRAARECKTHPKRFSDDGLVMMADLIANYRGPNEPIPFSMVADLLVALASLRVRDDAWSRMDPKHAEAHIRMWTHLTRLAPPGGFVAAPASLLAFVAWQTGDRALAQCALDRALADSPKYSMAVLLRQVISAGTPSSMARLPMSPEEVAESYTEKKGG